MVPARRIHLCTDKKRKFSSYNMEIQKGSGAKSYMWKGFLTYEEVRKYLVIIRRLLVKYDFAPDPF